LSRNLIILTVAAIVLIGGVILFAGSQGSSPVPSTIPTEAVQEQPSPTEVLQKEEGAPPKAGVEKLNVEIKNFAFGPKTLTVKKGTTIIWTNQDSVGHTATSDDGSFDTGLLAKGESESVTFDKAGTFTYHCTPHPYMKATIIVE